MEAIRKPGWESSLKAQAESALCEFDELLEQYAVESVSPHSKTKAPKYDSFIRAFRNFFVRVPSHLWYERFRAQADKVHEMNRQGQEVTDSYEYALALTGYKLLIRAASSLPDASRSVFEAALKIAPGGLSRL